MGVKEDLAVLEPKSEYEISHEAVDLESRAVPLPLSLIHSVELRERSDLHRLHHVWSEGLRTRCDALTHEVGQYLIFCGSLISRI